MRKVIITAAITGAELTKHENPNLPTTPAEQVSTAKACVKAGASIIHLHVRDDQENPSQELRHFENVRDLITKECDVIVQFSTGGAVGEKIENRIAPLTLNPEMASLNVGSINFGNEVFENLPQDIDALAMRMQKLGIKPEIEVYDIGMLEYGVRLVDKEVVAAPAHFQFVMGTKFGIQGSVENLKFMVGKLPANSTWAVAGVGRHQLELAKPAIELGGHVRCGLEDNIYFTKGVLAASNAQLVERIAGVVKDTGNEVATVKETRELLNLSV